MGWSCLLALGSSSRMEGQTDRQAPSPALPPRAELSSPARGGKLSADPNIAAAAARRSQNICVARQHEPAGLLCSAGAGIQQRRNRRRGSAAAPPHLRSAGSGWGRAAVKDPCPHSPRRHPRLCLAQGPARLPEGNLGMEKGSGVILWGSAQGSTARGPCSHVPAGMATCRGWERPPSPLLSPVPGGQCGQEVGTWDWGSRPERGSWADGRDVPLKADPLRSPRDGGICATKAQTQVRGEKTQPS